MRTIMFGLLLAIILAAAAPARAATGKTLGCASQGYTMVVPGAWNVVNACTRDSVAVSDDLAITMGTTVEKHGFWSDARAKSSIMHDLTVTDVGKGILARQPQFQALTVNGHHFIASNVAIVDENGTGRVNAEMETFYQGYMFKFTTVITTSGDSQVNDARNSAAIDVWRTIRIFHRG